MLMMPLPLSPQRRRWVWPTHGRAHSSCRRPGGHWDVYVDDLIIVAPNKATAAALEAVLAKQFVFEPGELAHLFLGANINRVSKHV